MMEDRTLSWLFLILSFPIPAVFTHRVSKDYSSIPISLLVFVIEKIRAFAIRTIHKNFCITTLDSTLYCIVGILPLLDTFRTLDWVRIEGKFSEFELATSLA